MAPPMARAIPIRVATAVATKRDPRVGPVRARAGTRSVCPTSAGVSYSVCRFALLGYESGIGILLSGDPLIWSTSRRAERLGECERWFAVPDSVYRSEWERSCGKRLLKINKSRSLWGMLLCKEALGISPVRDPTSPRQRLHHVLHTTSINTD